MLNKVNIVVTADADRYFLVDISGAKDPAFIKERIFNKVCPIKTAFCSLSFTLTSSFPSTRNKTNASFPSGAQK